jgi:hypothetical protein
MKGSISAESGSRLLGVFWNLSKKHVNPVNPVRPDILSQILGIDGSNKIQLVNCH